MKIYFVISIYIATFLTREAISAGENEIKRGVFPFMAIIYYPDSEINDDMGSRFHRGGILIRENWLISSSIEGKDDTQEGFPKKTLMARLGAIHVDTNFTFNEDEDEQEREIIQVVRPAYHKKQSWWRTDVNLLKTLLPFNMSLAVATTTFHSGELKVVKGCVILVYSRLFNNSNDDKLLMKLSVELLPQNKEECGNFFDPNSMVCVVQEKKKSIFHDSNFCQGNRGAPMLCDGEVVGIQTYVDDCNQPYLIQVLSSWEALVSCGMEDNCAAPKCSNVCETIYKDELTSSTKMAAMHDVSAYFMESDYKNISKIPFPIMSRVNDDFISSPTPTTVAEVTTSTPSIMGTHQTETWQSRAYSENSSGKDVRDEPAYAAVELPHVMSTEGEESSVSDVMSSMESLAGQTPVASEIPFEQSIEPIEESSVSIQEPVDTTILRSESVQYEPSPTEIAMEKSEEQTMAAASQTTTEQISQVEDLKVIDNRRKSHNRDESKDRRGKVEAQLQLPLPSPKGKSASGAKRLMSLPGVIISAAIYSFV